MEAVECGAASLAMVLSYYGRWISLEESRTSCGVSRDGASALNVIKAARMYGMEAKGLRVDLDFLDTLKRPAILHWGFCHFLVYCGKLGPYYVINDPAEGRCFMSREEVGAKFTGICITLQPGENFEKGGNPPSTLSFLTRRLQGAFSALLFSMLSCALLAVVSLSLPVFQQVFTDGIMTGQNAEWGGPFIVVLALVAIYQLIVNGVGALFGMRQRSKLAVVATSKFIWHILRLPMRFFSMRLTGDLISRISEAEQIPILLVQKLAPVVSNLVLLVVYVFFMAHYNQPLTWLVIGATLLVILTTLAIMQIQLNLSRQSERHEGKLVGVTMSCLDNIETIKAAGAEDGFYQRWFNAYNESLRANVKQKTIMAYANTVPMLLTQIAGNLVFIIGCKYILEGYLTIGMLMAFQGFMNTFIDPLQDLIDTSIMMSSMRVKMERVEDIYRTDPDVEACSQDTRDRGTGKLGGEVELRHVTFGYSPLAAPLITDFSMHIAPGKSVAFVGASGCGKSTLASLVSGLYQPWEGEVLYDGKPLNEINRATFTSSLSVINQDSSFFEGSISDNIKLWDESIEDFAMILACRDAQIHDEIARRQGSYQSVMTDGGKNFSGGQRQRMEIASALVKEPMILIMDEATSALDATTEAKVMQNVRNLGITLIIIAHRLSTIRDCDEIIVLDKGVVVERGTHDELMANHNKYYELVADA